MTEIPATFDSLKRVRAALQIPPGHERPPLHIGGPLSLKAVTRFEYPIQVRESLMGPTQSDVKTAKQIAAYINTWVAESELIPMASTLNNPEWLRQCSDPALRALGLMAIAYTRATEAKIITMETIDPGRIATRVTGEYLANRALLGSLNDTSSGADPALYLTPIELANTRLAFPEEHVTSGQFFYGMCRVASRKRRIPEYLALMYDDARFPPSQVYGVFRELVPEIPLDKPAC